MTGVRRPQDEQNKKLPQDAQDKKDCPNLRLKFLERLQEIAKGAFVDHGVVDNGLCLVEGVSARQFQSSNGWVNAPDTWTCKLADSHNDIVKSNVNAVSAAGSSLLGTIDSEISNIYANDKAMVREDDPDARWTPF